MATFTNEIMRGLLASRLKPATLDGKHCRSQETGQGALEDEFIDWLTIQDQTRSVATDVQRIRNKILVSREMQVPGAWIPI